MNKLGILCLLVAAVLCSSCYEYENLLDPDNPNNRISSPTYNPTGGTYNSAQSVSMSCAVSGAIIRYTTNGNEPNESSNLYSSPISVTITTTLKAKAYKSGYNPSQTTTSIYTLNLPSVATPTFNPPGGTYTAVQSVSISCTTGGASIRYTTNGNEPTENSNLYSSPISITSTTTIKAKAYKSGYNPSQTASSTYTINIPSVATPTFNPPGGTYTAVQSVSISCATPGATIRYTTNGNEPTENSNHYSSPISISNTTTIKAKAFKTGYLPSQTASSIYTVNMPMTVIFPNGGETLYIGQTYAITWVPGQDVDWVEIELWEGNSPSYPYPTIGTFVSNEGSYQWTLSAGYPNYIESGSNYRIKVRNHYNGGDVYDLSDSYFTIQ